MAFDRIQRNKRRDTRRHLSPPAKWGTAAAAAVLIVGVGVAGYFLGWFDHSGNPGDDPSSVNPASDTVIHFVAGGDVNVTDKVVSSGVSEGGYDYSDVLLDVVPVLSGADLTALNFEGNLYGEPYGTQNRSAPAELITALKNSGVDLLQTANSKSLTNGLRGLTATIGSIRQAGMQNLGTFSDNAEFERYQGYLIREVNGIRIALVAFTKGMDGSALPAGSETSVNLLYTDYYSSYSKINTEGITSVLQAVEKESPDITIAMLHWGGEYNDIISSTQTKIIKLMQEKGVDAIIGTHPHYVQQMGFDKDTGIFVAYSLGDFLGDGETAGTNYSVLLDLEITKDSKTGKTKITDYSYTPIYLQEEESGLRLLRIPEAMAAYESNYIDCVSPEVYESMKSALSRIKARVSGK